MSKQPEHPNRPESHERFDHERIDEWQRLARYDTNLQAELHATLLKNNGIAISVQALSAIPGMNSGAVLWVQTQDAAQAARILQNIDTDLTGFDEADVNEASDFEDRF